MAYTTIDNPELYFQTVLWTGNGSARSITLDGSENMQPDWLWGKNRGNDDNDYLLDSVRGVTKFLTTNNATAENTSSTLLSSFDSDGFSLGTSAGLNANTVTAVGWCWKAGGSASSNSNGSITSSVSANTTAGFSIVTWTAGSGVGSIGHGLGVAPSIIIVKGRSAAIGWVTGFKSNGWNNYLTLSGTNGNNDDQRMFSPSGQSDPTSTVWYQDHAALGSSGDTMVGYVFAEKKGYSKFGTYTGNGNANGTFVYTGFKPAWLLIKQSSGAGNDWLMYDTKRDTFNVANKLLTANGIGVEATGQSFNYIDLLSNGFKLRGSDARNNGSGGTMIYMAFAESPFVNSNGVPNNAR